MTIFEVEILRSIVRKPRHGRRWIRRDNGKSRRVLRRFERRLRAMLSGAMKP